MTVQNVLFDAPGPRARARSRIFSAVTVLAGLALLALIYLGLNRSFGDGAPPLTSPEAWQVNPDGQWAAERWAPFLIAETWTGYIVPGLQNTLTAALYAAVLAIVFGLVFGIGRLSRHAPIRWISGAVVEFFRGIPLLMLIFFTMALPLAVNQFLTAIGSDPLPPRTFQVDALAAVVVGLTLYNGSVLAEVFRAGINAVPKGQAEAAESLGMRRTQVLWLIQIPQAVTSMMPAIVAQLVVLLKDSALGYIIAFPELLRGFSLIGTRYGNVIPAAIICAAIYIIINISLSRLAIWLERRNARRGKASAHAAAAPGVQEPPDGPEGSAPAGPAPDGPGRP
ncbi:amino acid ABC transporter permease [Nocardiopsis sp. CNT-189]|uniref:amino acid ABC transporter permease n=1 Tax=Nocardiopsis oceanisediminis TaxID=2816862 RepID=UPI003B29F412